MASKDKSSGMKTAYELALERLERDGIARPDAESLSPEIRKKMAEVRSRAEASLAELEILHRDRSRKANDPAALEEEKEQYRQERERLERERDRKLAALRAESGPSRS